MKNCCKRFDLTITKITPEIWFSVFRSFGRKINRIEFKQNFSRRKFLVNLNEELFNGKDFLEGMRLMCPYPIFRYPLIQLVRLVHCIDEAWDQHLEHNRR